MFYFDPLYMIIAFGFLILSIWVSQRLKSKFRYYSKRTLSNNLSGAEIAQKMLDDHGVKDVKIICARGVLTDHYNPLKRTVNLSKDVYHNKSVSAAAVAAHECGHAVQHAIGYQWLQLRSRLVPVVSVAANLSQWLIMGGMVLMASSSFGFSIAVGGLILYALATIFSFITLPVEYDASNRALAWLKGRAIITPQEYKGAEDSLKWAARTYVVAAIGSLATLLYFAFRILGSRD